MIKKIKYIFEKGKIYFRLSFARSHLCIYLLITCCYLFGNKILNIGCPFRFVTGVSCPGCGMTRAWLSVASMDFDKAFLFHPLYWTVIPVGILLMKKDCIKGININIFLILMITAYMTVYLVRMLNMSDNIVSFEPKKGMAYRLAKLVFYYIKIWVGNN